MRMTISLVPAPQRLWLAAACLLMLAGVLTPHGAAAQAAAAEEGEPRLYSPQELEELIAPVALYPDDLLAIVLPASTYPLQIVAAARYLEAVREDPGLQADPSWDDSIVALLNYPEALALLNDDLDWTWRLGEAVINQQSELMAAVERFREQAYAAGNLRSDERQVVTRSEEIIEITPVEREVIYVPYYEPARVVVYQTVPVYHYYPRPCPVYYYPYPPGHGFASGFFWGVTTVFNVGWRTRHLYAFPPHHVRHPYYGHDYLGDHWRKRPGHHDRRAYRRDGRDRREHDVIWQPGEGAGARPGGPPPRVRAPGDAPEGGAGFAAERRQRIAPPDRRDGQVPRRWQAAAPETGEAPVARRSGDAVDRPVAEARPGAAARPAEPRSAQRTDLATTREPVGRRPDVRAPESVGQRPAVTAPAAPARRQQAATGELPATAQRPARTTQMPTLRSAPEPSASEVRTASSPAARRPLDTASGRVVEPTRVEASSGRTVVPARTESSSSRAYGMARAESSSRVVASSRAESPSSRAIGSSRSGTSLSGAYAPSRAESPSSRAIGSSRSASPSRGAVAPSQRAAPASSPEPAAAPSRSAKREESRSESASISTRSPGAARSGTASQRSRSRSH
jgi:hypothetical protein